MTRTVSEFYHWIKWKLLSLLLLTATLAASQWLLVEFERIGPAKKALTTLTAQIQDLDLRLLSARNQVRSLKSQLQNEVLAYKQPFVKAHELAVRAQAAKQSERASYVNLHPLLVHVPTSDPWRQMKWLDTQIAALRAATLAAQKVNILAHDTVGGAQASQKLMAEAQDKRSQALKLRVERQKFSAAHPWAQRIPVSDAYKQLESLDARIGQLENEAVEAETRSGRILAALKDPAFTEVAKLLGQINSTQSQIGQAEQERQHRAVERDKVNELYVNSIATQLIAWRDKGWSALRPFVLPALGILLLAAVVPLAIKAFLYFVIAPLASMRPPIRLLPRAHGDIQSGSREARSQNDPGRVSAVSVPINLAHGRELLIRPEYLQSTSQDAVKNTQVLLNSAIPWSCLLSGMYMLTKVQSPSEDKVVVSSTKDALSEIAIINLPAGAAFVCQPRCLVGVVQHRDRLIRITRHWRIGNLQAWLTLQLRFLVFHGPGQLVAKGCRGVRLENAGKGRLINQAATLGFSANLAYATTRCETFWSYWTGKEDLFNDLFIGDAGAYMYEEMPDLKHKSGITGRGLEGLSDALLKLLGI